MRVLTSVLLAVSSAFAYQVTFPGDSQGWNTTGPNFLKWQRVDTDPTSFAVVLTNQNTGYDEILDSVIDGTLGSVQCSTPAGGWPSGTDFRVNIAQDATHLGGLLAQSDGFNITQVSSNGSTTTSASAQTATSLSTSTSSAPSTSSSQTSTSPTGTSAAFLGADAQAGLISAVAALTVLITTLL
ncbi:GPI-anchored small secreted protein [Boletus reticuloceps]|uniref:GPI-anchored small secreted protein n=1 Tax=Boletus reticuloceps TaxID=495285 RepID=A0A8I2YWR6_9AGAM|nr:GPI-anchored small secreted protein [Boletus reticuloceps]